VGMEKRKNVTTGGYVYMGAMLSADIFFDIVFLMYASEFDRIYAVFILRLHKYSCHNYMFF